MKKNNENETVTKQGVFGILWNLSGSLVQIVLQFIVLGILARLLTPEEFGIVALILILVQFSYLFIDLGIASAVVQLPNITKKHISQGYTFSTFIGIFLGVLFFFFGPLIGTFFGMDNLEAPIRFFSLFLPLNSINAMSHATLLRKLKFSAIVKCNIFSYIFGTGLISIVLALLDFGYWSLILGYFASALLLTISMMIVEKPVFTFSFNKKVSHQLLFFGSGHTLGTVFNYFAENTDNIVVGKFLGPVSLGIYSKAFQLLSIPASFFGGIYDKVLFPILSKKSENKKLLSDFYLFSSAVCFGILFPISIIIFINAESIVLIVLGKQWIETIVLLQILIVGLPYRFGTRINKSYFKSMALVYTGAWYQLLFAVMILAGAIIGSMWNGLQGIAYGVLLSTVINYFLASIKIRKELKTSNNVFFEIQIKALLFHLPFLALTIFINHLFETNLWHHFFLSLVLYLPIMIFLFLFNRSIIFNTNNHDMISLIVNSLPSIMKKTMMRFNFFNKYYS